MSSTTTRSLTPDHRAAARSSVPRSGALLSEVAAKQPARMDRPGNTALLRHFATMRKRAAR
eukprot:7218661-Lingulodinium_polyedra.AAC.1